MKIVVIGGSGLIGRTWKAFQRNVVMQRDLGVPVQMLDAQGAARLVPQLNVRDLRALPSVLRAALQIQIRAEHQTPKQHRARRHHRQRNASRQPPRNGEGRRA